MAAQTGFVYRLDRYMWDKAVKQLAEWKKRGINDYHISVNISTKDRNNLPKRKKKITLDKPVAKSGCDTFVGAGSQAEYGRFEGAQSLLYTCVHMILLKIRSCFLLQVRV